MPPRDPLEEPEAASCPKAGGGGYGHALGGAVVGAVGALAYGNAVVGAALRPR